MAMVICPECNKEVSSEASACPGCGYDFAKLKKKKKQNGCTTGCLGLIILSIILSIILYIMGGEEEPKISVNYSILKQWKPHKISNSLGVDILLNDDLSEDEIISFLKQISKKKNPVVIRIFTNIIAYEQENNNNFGLEYKKGYLLYYLKNDEKGTNEIRWFQEIGKFSQLNGQKTIL